MARAELRRLGEAVALEQRPPARALARLEVRLGHVVAPGRRRAVAGARRGAERGFSLRDELARVLLRGEAAHDARDVLEAVPLVHDRPALLVVRA